MSKPLLLVILIASLLPVAMAQTQKNVSKAKKPKSVTYADETPTEPGVPESYKKRVAKFREIIRKEPTREAKIQKALSLARDPKSPYRIDAINFLADTKSEKSVPGLIELAKDTNLAEFALFALGEARSAKAIPTLIDALSSENENVRGNAERSLQKITQIYFLYSYSSPEPQRKNDIEQIREWWKENKATFVVRDPSDAEKKDSEEAWELYGKKYIQDLSR